MAPTTTSLAPAPVPASTTPTTPAARSSWRRWLVAFVILLAVGGATAGVLLWSPWMHAKGPADDTPEYHLQQARMALEQRDFESARSHLQHCLEAWPFGSEIVYLMAQTCRRMDDDKGWQTYLPVARLLQWPMDDLQEELRLHEAQTGDIWSVNESLEAELDDAPRDREILIREALCKGYLDNDVPRRASDIAEAWLNHWPNDWEAWMYHGRAYQEGTMFNQAIPDFKKALEIKPDCATARLWLAEVLLQLQQFEQSQEQFRIYLDQHPVTVECLWGLAKTQYQLGQHEAASATLKRVTDKDPNYVPALLLRAKLIQAEHPKEALALLRRAIKLRPNMTDLLHNLILALHQLAGQIKGAEAEAQMYQRRLDQRQPVITEIEKRRMQLLKEPDNLDLRFEIGKRFLKLGDEEEAAHWFQTILFMDPNHRPTCEALAEYWEQHGNPSKAAHYRRKAGDQSGGRTAMPSAKSHSSSNTP